MQDIGDLSEAVQEACDGLYDQLTLVREAVRSFERRTSDARAHTLELLHLLDGQLGEEAADEPEELKKLRSAARTLSASL